MNEKSATSPEQNSNSAGTIHPTRLGARLFTPGS
jgi:hypothetical protein